MKALITGGAGLLGQALVRSAPDGVDAVPTWRRTAPTVGEGPQADLTDPDQVESLLGSVKPDVVVHTAYTQSAEVDVVTATTRVAEACARHGSGLIHLSTDLVFDGTAGPYGEDHPAVNPVDDYGRWKARTETIVADTVADAAIVRTSLLVSTNPVDPRTQAIVDALRNGHEVRLFVDELRTPLAVDDLAEGLWQIAQMGTAGSGVWHLAGVEALSRYTLGVLVAAAFGLDPAGITPSRQADHPTPRAADVRLLTERADRELDMTPRTMAELLSSSGHMSPSL